MKKLTVSLILVCLCAFAAWAGELTGYISDAKCGAAHMDGSEASIKCVKGCVKGGQAPVLVTADKKVIKISNPAKVQDEHLGQKVTVTGDVAGDTLTIDTIKKAA